MTDDLRDRAAQVRDYLVAVRGGAPFLSAADDRLLLGWLEADVPVARIVAAVDQVAETRRRKRVRSRLTLSACKKAVERHPASAPVETFEARPANAASPGPGHGLAALADEIAAASTPGPTDSAPAAHLAELVDTLRHLDNSDQHVDEIGREATAAIARFHAAAWSAAAAEHTALRSQAEAQLAPLRQALRGSAWTDMVEEVARDLLRQRTPAVSARRVWDRLAP